SAGASAARNVSVRPPKTPRMVTSAIAPIPAVAHLCPRYPHRRRYAADDSLQSGSWRRWDDDLPSPTGLASRRLTRALPSGRSPGTPRIVGGPYVSTGLRPGVLVRPPYLDGSARDRSPSGATEEHATGCAGVVPRVSRPCPCGYREATPKALEA